MRRESCGARRHAHGLSVETARRRDRNLQRSSHGDVFRDSRIESARDKTQESCLREEDLPELLPETRRAASGRIGRGDFGREDGTEVGYGCIVRGLSQVLNRNLTLNLN